MLNWRKCVAVAAVGAMLAVPVAAEAPGVHDLTDDELKALYMDVKNEMAERGLFESVIVPAGEFVGGVDLPVGKFVFASLDSQAYMQCYSSKETYTEDKLNNSYKHQMYDFVSKDGSEVVIDIEEGRLYCFNDQTKMTRFTGIEF